MKGKSYISESFLKEKLDFLRSLAPLTPDNKWKLALEQNNIKIYLKLDESSKLYIVRAEAVANVSINKVTDLLRDNDKVITYDSTLESLKILEETENQWVVYTISKKPSILIDKRDCVTLTSYQKDGNEEIFVGGTINHHDFPAKNSPVRCEIPIWGWVLTPISESKTKLIYIVLADPKGSVPKSVINAFCREQGMCVRNVRNIVEQRKNSKNKINPKL
jgi:hypothetical protein